MMEEAEGLCGTPYSTDKSILSGSMPQGTPKPPFEPPRRRSSLAFSKIFSPCYSQEKAEKGEKGGDNTVLETPTAPESNITRKRVVKTPNDTSTTSPSHITQSQKFLQNAKNSLHLDMHFAASPVGSIDAHLPQQYTPTNSGNSKPNDEQNLAIASARHWRYSTVPQFLATIHMDVREPLPESSPTLPTNDPLNAADLVEGEDFVEPISSGFATPNDGLGEDMFGCLPPLPPSSPPPFHNKVEDAACLEEPMNELTVDGNDESSDTCMEDSPYLSPLSQRSEKSADSPIFLSHTAKVAAESARAKRGFIRNPFHPNSVRKASGLGIGYPEPIIRPLETCPNPYLHQSVGLSICPDPTLHTRALTPASVMVREPTPSSSAPRTVHCTRPYVEDRHPVMSGPRVNAMGSPMPFTKQRIPLMPAFAAYLPNQSYQTSSVRTVPRINRLCSTPRNLLANNMVDDPQDSVHNAQRVSRSRQQAFSKLYSFSTEAAKITGESAAPDSRIRDSYRTDTLTPSVQPPHRFKKHGFGTGLGQRGSNRFYGPLPQRMQSPYHSAKPRGKFRYGDMADVRFRSSPPKPSAGFTSTYKPMKRRRNPNTHTPNFYIAEDGVTEYTSDQDSDVVAVDEEMRAAVRKSVFGSETPEPLYGAREGIRELSPQVSIWRKDLRRAHLVRKKRRPSYWDDDLEEVKMSPAARGGIESSPTMSKRSMMAQVETVTSNSTNISLDGNMHCANVDVQERASPLEFHSEGGD